MNIAVKTEHALTEIGMSSATLCEIVRMDRMSMIVHVTHHITMNARMDIALKHGRGVMEMLIAMTTQMNCTVLPAQESFSLNAK